MQPVCTHDYHDQGRHHCLYNHHNQSHHQQNHLLAWTNETCVHSIASPIHSLDLHLFVDNGSRLKFFFMNLMIKMIMIMMMMISNGIIVFAGLMII